MSETFEISEVPLENNSKLFNRIKLLLQQFDVNTSGRNKANAVKWVLHKISLLIIWIIFGHFTASTSYDLIASYAASKTSFTPQSKFNQSVALPQSSICVDVIPAYLDVYSSNQNSFSVPPSHKTNHYQTSLVAFFNGTNVSKDAILNIEKKWPNSLLYVAHYYLFLIQQFEGFYTSGTIGYIKNLNVSSRDIAIAINILDNKMKLFDISVQELKNKYGAQVATVFNITAAFYDQGVLTSTRIEIDRVSLVEHSLVCINMRFDQQSLKNRDSIIVQAHISEALDHPDEYFQSAMYLAMGDVYELGNLEDISITFSALFDNILSTIMININSVYQKISRKGGELVCSETSSEKLCESNCRTEYIQVICSCISANGDKVGPFNLSLSLHH